MKQEFKEKAAKLVEQMTVEEAASQLRYDSPAIDRLGIPEYNWWTEGLHGIARAGTATVFPQAIALAAGFDRKLMRRVAEVVSTEARALYNEYSEEDDRDIYKGITIWSPNINIFRDPRWGRGQETYGEDPFLTAELGVEFIKGLQGDGKYLKTAACAKHFAVHSGPEAVRHSFNAEVSKKDLEETYLPQFHAAVKEAEVAGIMGAYNRVNGEPCCGSQTLDKKIARDEWGFDGYFVSDCWAIRDFHENHLVTSSPEESAAMALKATCDLNCGNTYLHILKAYQEGLITENEIREAAVRVFTVRYALGMFDDDCEYNSIGYDAVDTKESKEFAYRTAVDTTVLLKNDGILPLKREDIHTIGVIGPTATSKMVLEGNYNGLASEYVTNLDGIREAAGDSVRILYSEGCHLFQDKVMVLGRDDDRLAEAAIVAKHSDVVVLCLGLDSTLEGEEGDTGNSFAAGDKNTLYLPESQRRLYNRVIATGKPVILILNTGSAMDLSDAERDCKAVIQSWYSGEYGGRAIGRILFGDESPGGRLPVTFYKEGTLPDFLDYSMKGRTYRYMEAEPLYPFGYGLSYTTFEQSILGYDEATRTITVRVANTGDRAGADTVQVYISSNPVEKLGTDEGAQLFGRLDPDNQPRYSLAGFEKVHLEAGESRDISIELPEKVFDIVLEDGERVRLHGEYTLYAGGHQPDKRSRELTGTDTGVIKVRY